MPVRQGKTGLACTDGQNQWTSGAKKNAGQHKMKQMSFKRHNRHTFYRIPPSKTSPPKAATCLFKSSRMEGECTCITFGCSVYFPIQWPPATQLQCWSICAPLLSAVTVCLNTVCPVCLLSCPAVTSVCYCLPCCHAAMPCSYLLSALLCCLACCYPLSVLFALLVCCYALLSSVCYCLPPYCCRLSVLLSGPLRLYCDLGLYKLNWLDLTWSQQKM